MSGRPRSPGAAGGRDPRWAWALYAALVLGLLAWTGPRANLYNRAFLPDMVTGSAWRPYVKRVLAPLAIRAGAALLPAPASAALDRAVERHPRIARRLGWRTPHADWYALATLLHGLALFGFALAFRALARRTFVLDRVTASLAGAAALLFLPIHFGFQNYVYDFPSLALFTLGLLALARDELRAYALLWPIGLLNKETYLLLLPVFLLRCGRTMPRSRLLLAAAAQAAVAVAIWLALGRIFRANPGGPVEVHLLRNLTHLPSARQFFLHDVVYWGAWIVGLLFWREKRPVVAEALAVIGLLYATTFVFGLIGEYRDFYEAWPLLALLLLHTALRVLGRRPVLRTRERPRGREAAAGVDVHPEPAGLPGA